MSGGQTQTNEHGCASRRRTRWQTALLLDDHRYVVDDERGLLPVVLFGNELDPDGLALELREAERL